MALTTLAKLKQYLGITSTNDDAMLTELLASAEAFVLSYIDTNIEVQPFSERYNGTGSTGLVPDHTPIQSVTSLKVDGMVISPSAAHGQPGYFFDSTMIVLRGYKFTRGRLNVELSYTAGYPQVPADVTQAVNYIAAQMYKRKDRIGVSSKTIGQESISYDANDLDTKSAKILNAYKRRWLSR